MVLYTKRRRLSRGFPKKVEFFQKNFTPPLSGALSYDESCESKAHMLAFASSHIMPNAAQITPIVISMGTNIILTAWK